MEPRGDDPPAVLRDFGKKEIEGGKVPPLFREKGKLSEYGNIIYIYDWMD